MGWKDQEKDRKEKKAFAKELIKPFTIRNYRFFPCNYSRLLLDGYRYYLMVRDYNGNRFIELNSPMFRTIDDCKAFAFENKIFPWVLA
jgi:hypothetical protein